MPYPMTDNTLAEFEAGSEWWWEARRQYLAVRADQVKRGDLYANGATVTSSRKARAADLRHGPVKMNNVPVPIEDCWRIATGKSFSVTTRRDRPIVVGRRIAASNGRNPEQ